MAESGSSEAEVYAFIQNKIDSVPHLEALLLLWNTRPDSWPIDDLARRLYVERSAAQQLLEDLRRQGLVDAVPDDPSRYCYLSKPEDSDGLIAAVDRTYRRQIIPVSTMIHSKASPAVRDFARAFRFTKERP